MEQSQSGGIPHNLHRLTLLCNFINNFADDTMTDNSVLLLDQVRQSLQIDLCRISACCCYQ